MRELKLEAESMSRFDAFYILASGNVDLAICNSYLLFIVT